MVGVRSRTGALRAVLVAGMAGAVALAGSVSPLGSAVADPGDSGVPGVPGGPLPVSSLMPVPLVQAGQVRLTGSPAAAGEGGIEAVPAAISQVAVSQVALSDSVGLALTSAGRVLAWGANPQRVQRVPEELDATPVAQVTIGSPAYYAGAVTRAGRVVVWGPKLRHTTALDVPSGLSDVKQLAIAEQSAAALKTDGSIVAWGEDNEYTQGILEVPEELRPGGSAKAVAVVAGGRDTFYALTDQGTVMAWGIKSFGTVPPPSPNRKLQLPAAVKEPGAVKSLVANSNGAMAWMSDGSLIYFLDSRVFPQSDQNVFPASVAGLKPAQIAGGCSGGGGATLGMIDDAGMIHGWRPGFNGATQESRVSAELAGAPVTQLVASCGVGSNEWLSAAIVAAMLPAEPPSVNGAARVGSVLTATPGTFSGAPDQVSGQWLADGTEIAGATGERLTLTQGLVGKKISYRSTASKSGEESVSSTSAVTAAVVSAAPVKVASRTKVTRVVAAKRAVRLTVSVKVSASRSVAGRATVSIKKGTKTIVSQRVVVNSKGSVRLSVNKFGALVAKKLKAKGKRAKTAYRGTYVVRIVYAGNGAVKPSTGVKRFTIKR